MNLYFIAAWELLKSIRISKLVKIELIVRLILLVSDSQASIFFEFYVLFTTFGMSFSLFIIVA